MTPDELQQLANTAEIVRIVPHVVRVTVPGCGAGKCASVTADAALGFDDLPEDVRALCEAVPRLVEELQAVRHLNEVRSVFVHTRTEPSVFAEIAKQDEDKP